MVRPTVYRGRVSTNLRVEPGLLDAFKAMAEDRDVSVNYLIVKAMTRYLEHTDTASGSGER